MNERTHRDAQCVTRKSTVDLHPQVADIVSDLLGGMPQRQVAKKYGLSTGAVHRYCQTSLKAELANSAQQADQNLANSLVATMSRLLDPASKLLTACDEWLTDPDNPAHYTLEPRASEIEVIYFDDNKIKRRATLQELLTKTQSQLNGVQKIDTRILLLSATREISGIVERLARMTSSQVQQVHVTNTDVSLEKIKSILLEELEGYPEILDRVCARIALL